MPLLIKIQPSKNKAKKHNALFRLEDNKFKTVSFGDANSQDYLEHRDLSRRASYLKRHLKDLRTKDPLRPGFLAYYVGWSGFEQPKKPTVSIPKLIKLYNEKFFKH